MNTPDHLNHTTPALDNFNRVRFEARLERLNHKLELCLAAVSFGCGLVVAIIMGVVG